MPAPAPYVTYDDMKAVCPYLDNLQPGVDEFEPQRVSARRWFDRVVMAALGVREPVEIDVDDQVVKACAYYATAEVLAQQITPMVDQNAYQGMAARNRQEAEAMICGLVVSVMRNGQAYGRLKLGVSRRGGTV